jgi:hypothetical protein
MSKNRATEFLRNMGVAEVGIAPAVTANGPTEQQLSVASPPKRSDPRANLKHIGGYFDVEMVEKIAILRARLKLDNSELIKLAIDDLYRKHNAKRAFGD